MTLQDKLIRWFGKLGEVAFEECDHKMTRDNPLHLTPNEWKDNPPSPHVRAWLYKRYNDALILRIDMSLPFIAKLSSEEVTRLDLELTEKFGKMPYGEVRFRSNDGDNFHIVITHSLYAPDVSSEGLAEVINGMMYVTEHAESAVVDLGSGPSSSIPPVPSAEQEEGENAYDLPEFCDGGDDLEDISDLIKDREEYDAIQQQRKKLSFEDVHARVHEVQDEETLEGVLRELESMIGLASVKKTVRVLVAQQRIAKMRQEAGLRAQLPSPHLIFTGNPGTGKTTIARKIGRIYKLLGLLEKGHVIEADRASLVAPYIGQTALKTKAICEQALGGVLFIDEAYSLKSGYDNDFGHEAVEALMTFMENNRGRFVVVVAGYSDLMNTFIKANPGLASRFDVTIDFPDYSNTELGQILSGLAVESSYRFTPEATHAAQRVIEAWPREKGFGNGRSVRKLFNEIIANQAMLLDDMSDLDTERLEIIPVEAIPVLVGAGLEKAGPRTASRGGFLGYL